MGPLNFDTSLERLLSSKTCEWLEPLSHMLRGSIRVGAVANQATALSAYIQVMHLEMGEVGTVLISTWLRIPVQTGAAGRTGL
jgi:hypothetical protein